MRDATDMVAPPVTTTEARVVRAAAETAEAAWRLAQDLGPYGDAQYRLAQVHVALRDAFAEHVPGWAELVGAIADGFETTGIVLLRGLRFDAGSVIAVGLLAALGRPSAMGAYTGQVVRDIRPERRPPNFPDFEQHFHTNSSLLARPHEALAFQCVEPDAAGGGLSRFVHIDAVLATMRRHGHDAAIETLKDRLFPFARPAFLWEGIVGMRILEPSQAGPDGFEVRFQREPILSAAAEVPAAFDEDMGAAFDAFEVAMNTPGVGIEHRLEPHEMAIVNNRVVLHARTKVFGGPGSERHIKRIKAYRP